MSLAWSEERYARLYTRDTPNWLLGPWEARAVLPLVLRKVDRAGVLDLGDDGLEALAVVVALPLDVVQVGMAWWLKRGTFELGGGRLVLVNYLAAQEARATDALRAREHRARTRDRRESSRKPSRNVMRASRIVMVESRNVMRASRRITRRHTASRLAVLCLAFRAVTCPPYRAKTPRYARGCRGEERRPSS